MLTLNMKLNMTFDFLCALPKQYWNLATVNSITLTTVNTKLKENIFIMRQQKHGAQSKPNPRRVILRFFLSACLDLYPLKVWIFVTLSVWEGWRVKACPAGAAVTKGRWLPGQPCVCGRCQAGATPWPNKAGAMAGYDLKTERKGQTDWPSSSRAQWGTYSTDWLLMD